MRHIVGWWCINAARADRTKSHSFDPSMPSEQHFNQIRTPRCDKICGNSLPSTATLVWADIRQQLSCPNRRQRQCSNANHGMLRLPTLVRPTLDIIDQLHIQQSANCSERVQERRALSFCIGRTHLVMRNLFPHTSLLFVDCFSTKSTTPIDV
jgi:hypothetical protein